MSQLDPGQQQPAAPRRRAAATLGLATGALLGTLAMPAALDAQGRAIRFERISIEQGLSQATVTCILQDATGFIWIGTQDGLDRYDGYRFRVFSNDPGAPSTIASNWVFALVEDPSGDLWIGTRGGGLNRWQRERDAFSSYRHDPEDPHSLSGDQVRALLLDRQGKLWVGTEQSGLNRFDPSTGRAERFRHGADDPQSLPDDRIRALHQDRSGAIWVGTLGGLARLDQGGGFARFENDPADPSSLSDDRVRSILEDREGALWVGTFGGLNRLEAGRTPKEGFERFVHAAADPASLSENRTRVLFEDSAGRLWIGTDGGLSLFDRASESFVRYRDQAGDSRSLANDRVSAIYQDSGGVLWVGTQGGGLNKWDPRTWSFSNDKVRPSQLSGRDVVAITQGPGGALWVGTGGHGVNRIDRERGTVRTFRHDPDDPSSLGDDRVTALLHSRRGELWIGTQASGLNRFVRASETFERFDHDPHDPSSLGSTVIMTLFEDSRETLWVGTFGGGLNRLDAAPAGAGKAAFTRFTHDPEDPRSLSDDRVMSIAEDRPGFLWLGTLGSGLDRFDPRTETARRFRHDPQRPESLSNDVVADLHFDPAGNLWIGTQVGLNRLERLDAATGEAVFRRYLEQDGLPNNLIYGIESDGGGGLWLATNRGLSRFDPRTETFKNFDTSHGLYSDEFNVGAHYRGPSGELFFGGIDGYNAFHPDRIELNHRPPPVVLTAFSKLNRPVELDRPVFDLEQIALTHRDAIVSFEFAALDFSAPERNRYRYKLEGFSNEWLELGDERRVSFTNLDAGSYVLRVQGSNNDGVWNAEGAAIRIAVAPAPWRSVWAYSLYALALAGVVFGFVRSQQRKVERERAISRRLREVDKLRSDLLANLKEVVDQRTAQVAERERLLAELEAKNAELERFNYTVSHDLKSPLVTIKGFLGMLERDTAAGQHERARHDIRRIHAAADRMTQLLDELLHLSRLGHETVEPESVALDAVAREALDAVAGAIEKRGVEIEIDPDLPVVLGERIRLREVYQNLIANAVKYMGDQRAPRVEVGARWNGAETVFTVRDNGSGIDPRYHDKVFGLFERLDSAEEGTGIGLALAKRIVERHGGRIWVESEGAGRGSTFCFTLPQAADVGERRNGAGAAPAARRRTVH